MKTVKPSGAFQLLNESNSGLHPERITMFMGRRHGKSTLGLTYIKDMIERTEYMNSDFHFDYEAMFSKYDSEYQYDSEHYRQLKEMVLRTYTEGKKRKPETTEHFDNDLFEL